MAGDYSNGQLLLGDPDEFAQEMIKLINDKEFRLVSWVGQYDAFASRERHCKGAFNFNLLAPTVSSLYAELLLAYRHYRYLWCLLIYYATGLYNTFEAKIIPVSSVLISYYLPCDMIVAKGYDLCNTQVLVWQC